MLQSQAKSLSACGAAYHSSTGRGGTIITIITIIGTIITIITSSIIPTGVLAWPGHHLKRWLPL